MGCDIHAAIEYLNDGKWTALELPNKYFGKYGDEEKMTTRVDIDRDYDLFAILGNVRNGTAFAGCKTGDGFDPMSDNRGTPDDASEGAIKALSNEHSPTWVTLAEILAYDWRRTSRHQGYADAKSFEEWDRMKEWNLAPPSYCGDVSGGRTEKITNAEMRIFVGEIIQQYPGHRDVATKVLAESGKYTLVEWTETYSEAGKQIWTAILPHMLALGTQYGHANVRLVMDFDS